MPPVGRLEGSYNPHQVEKWVKEFWEKNSIYHKLKEASKGRPRFYFLDGPPYPSSDVPHAGTAWNKVLKDAIIRFKRMQGYDVHDQPGYDCHGLPIEVKVEQALGIRVKKEIESKVGVDRFIEECKKLVLKNIEGLTQWFKELGVFMDWSRPYLTLTDEYIEAGWWLLKKVFERGLLVQEYRVVYWCPRCGTTLAEYEIEYRNLEDPSIYVKFPVEGRDNEYLLVWTTTPWTLPANAFIMAHPDATYVKVKVGSETLILAKSRLEAVMREAGVSSYEVICEFKGKDLEGLRYKHPLEDLIPLQGRLSKYHRVVLAAEYVSLDEGTGLVHAAPGHGFEDFEVARKLGVEVAAPVNDEGKFTEEAGKYAGLAVREANEHIIEDLRRKGALFHAGKIVHRYPTCWRCKTPVVLRATKQWVIKVTKLKEEVAREVQRVVWIPRWAYDRIKSMVDNLQDWVISRQRYWGLPLPIWICEKCGHVVVVGSIKELESLGGRKPKELHKPWIDQVKLRCPKCGGTMHRVPDVADVWFDSGIAFYASLGHPEKLGEEHVADIVVEGHDQTRGWFFSLLRAGVLGFGKVPYRRVLVHGFMLDEKGREMHKSLGNYVGTDEILTKMGSDVFRFWILQNTVWEDARFSWRSLEEARRDLNVAWNVFVFASTYMNLDGFDPHVHTLEKLSRHLKFEDRWLLSRLSRLIRKVSKAFEEYKVHEAARALREFIVEDVSRWYIRLVRRRVWTEETTEDKYAVYATLYAALKAWLTMAAPIIPFFTEYVYQIVVRPAEPELPLSVHMLSWPKPLEEYEDEELEKEMEVVKQIYEACAAARMKAGLKLRQPVRKVVVYTSEDRVRDVVLKNADIVLRVTNAREVEVKPVARVEEIVSYKLEPVYSKLGPEFKSFTPMIIEYLKANEDKVAKDLLTKGVHEAVIEGAKITLTKEHVKVIPTYVAGFSAHEAPWGCIAIDTRLSDEEIAEGLARDVVRRIQYMRKEAGLHILDYIEALIGCPEEHKRYLEMKSKYIAEETRAKTLTIVDDLDYVERAGREGWFVKRWEVGGAEYVIAIRRISSAG